MHFSPLGTSALLPALHFRFRALGPKGPSVPKAFVDAMSSSVSCGDATQFVPTAVGTEEQGARDRTESSSAQACVPGGECTADLREWYKSS